MRAQTAAPLTDCESLLLSLERFLASRFFFLCSGRDSRIISSSSKVGSQCRRPFCSGGEGWWGGGGHKQDHKSAECTVDATINARAHTHTRSNMQCEVQRVHGGRGAGFPMHYSVRSLFTRAGPEPEPSVLLAGPSQQSNCTAVNTSAAPSFRQQSQPSHMDPHWLCFNTHYGTKQGTTLCNT